MKDKEFIKYYEIAQAEMQRILTEFNQQVIAFWLKYNLYPIFERDWNPLGYDGKPTSEPLRCKKLDILSNPIKLLVEVKEESKNGRI